jgi:hypothetical protein
MDLIISQKIIKDMATKKDKPTKAQILANKLVKQHQDNEKLQQKIIKIDLFKLFSKK